MNNVLKPNIEHANLHLEFLSGQKRSNEMFQIYADSKQSSVLPQILIGTLEQHWDRLVDANRRGAAIAVVVNQTDFKGRCDKNIVRIRSFFTDDDKNLNKAIAMDPPSFRVLSKRGPHKYYVGQDFEISIFKSIQKLLAAEAETDPQVCDLGRVMRLAGFFHMKNPQDPFLVKIESDFKHDLQAKLNTGK